MKQYTDPTTLLLRLLGAWLLASGSAIGAQPVSAVIGNAVADATISEDRITAGRDTAESDTDLNEEQRKKALELYDQASRWLRQALEIRAQRAELEVRVDGAPQRIEAIRSNEAIRPPALPAIDPVLATDKAEEIDLALTQENLALRQAKEAENALSDELEGLLLGGQALGEEIGARIDDLNEIDKEIDAELRSSAAEAPSALRQARAAALKARRMFQGAELELFKLRLGSHELLIDLIQAERDFTQAQISAHQQRVDTLSKAAQALREAEARQGREQAEALERSAEALPPALHAIAEENARFRRELEEVIDRENAVSGDLQATRRRLDEITTDFERTRQRVEAVGTTPAIGRLLIRRREALRLPQADPETAAALSAENERATDRQIDIDELLRERGPVPAVAARVVESLPEPERQRHEAQALELARSRRDALEELQKVYGRYTVQIASLSLAERRLMETVATYTDYIDHQLIWLPGPGIREMLEPARLGESLAWLFSGERWAEVANVAHSVARQRPFWTLAIGLGFLLLLRERKRAAGRIRRIAREVDLIRTDSFALTLQALGLTLVVTGAWPLLLIGSGWLLSTSLTAASFSQSVAQGLVLSGISLAILSFIIQICQEDGVGDRHLRWPRPVRDALVRETRWIRPVTVPLLFVVVATADYEPVPVAQFLGRLAFILLSVLIAVFVYRLGRRRGLLMQVMGGADGLLVRLHFLWFPLMLILPVSLALTSALGYHYAAWHLDLRAEQTLSFFIGLFLLKELLLRSLYVAERRLRLKDALRRKEESRAQRAQRQAEKEGEPPPVALDIPAVSFDELSEQSKRLVRAGFLFGAVLGIWVIWSDLVPALSFLSTTELPFYATRIADGIATQVPVTLGDLTFALMVALITVLSAKNIPGVLEITLLRRLPLDSGARYATTTLFQYAIVGMGVFLAFGTLGLQWSKIQWLVAALGVGVGFGLQEVVANFVSGIILLFERPVRVGDVVTIDNATGVVSRIRIRATTITKYDKQELLVPNKMFITGQVTNWTLADMTNRVLINVGVAYGTDATTAMALMLEAAKENENVLTDPKPVVTFEAFGDNALNLVLRSYLGSVDNRLSTITALHKAIYAKFNAAGVKIPFPQRDLHLETDGPLDIRLHKATGGRAAKGTD